MTETRPNPSLPGFNEQLIDQFRAHHGQIPEGPFAGAPILLLGTTGARSGQPRTHPLAYTRDGERYVIIASKGGAPSHPDWYHNLRANPIVTVEVGGERFRAQASVAEGSERERLYAQQAKQMPGFAEYQRKTTRRIPVVVLDRID
jgi:deazaflavin-dependent oxidoreductase (nitroreductase family)